MIRLKIEAKSFFESVILLILKKIIMDFEPFLNKNNSSRQGITLKPLGFWFMFLLICKIFRNNQINSYESSSGVVTPCAIERNLQIAQLPLLNTIFILLGMDIILGAACTIARTSQNPQNDGADVLEFLQHFLVMTAALEIILAYLQFL